jgi:hypothetical protein
MKNPPEMLEERFFRQDSQDLQDFDREAAWPTPPCPPLRTLRSLRENGSLAPFCAIRLIRSGTPSAVPPKKD